MIFMLARLAVFGMATLPPFVVINTHSVSAQESPPDHVRIQLNSAMFSTRGGVTYQINSNGAASVVTSPVRSSTANVAGLSLTPSLLVNVTSLLSLSFGVPYVVRLDSARATPRNGVGDTSFGVNYIIFEQAGKLPMIAIGSQVSAPTAAANFGSGRWGITGTVIATEPVDDRISAFALAEITEFIGYPSEPLHPNWAIGWGVGIRAIATERVELVATVGDVTTSYLAVGAAADKSNVHNTAISLTGFLYNAGIPWFGLTVGVDQLQSGRPGFFATVKFVALSY